MPRNSRNLKEIYITENGGVLHRHVLTPKGHVYDTDRVMYLRNTTSPHLQRAVTEGVPVKGYFCWSFMDNYE